MAEIEEKRRLDFILLRKNNKIIQNKIKKEIPNAELNEDVNHEHNSWFICCPREISVVKEGNICFHGNGEYELLGKKLYNNEDEAHQALLESSDNEVGYFIDCGEDFDKFLEEVKKANEKNLNV